MILEVWHNHEKNIKLDQAEFVYMGSLIRAPAFSVAVWLKYAPKCGTQWVSWKHRIYLFWFSVREGIQRLREIGMLEWICHLRSAHPHPGRVWRTYLLLIWEINCEGSPGILEEFCDCFSGNAVTESGNLNAMGGNEFQGGRGPVVTSNCQRQGEPGLDRRVKVTVIIVWLTQNSGVG